MCELGPDHVPGGAVDILASPSHAGGHLGLDGPHGLIDRLAEGGQQLAVAGEGIGKRHAIWEPRR